MSGRLPIPFEIEVFCNIPRDGARDDKLVFHRRMEVGVMETSKVRSLCTRNFNKWLKHYQADSSVIVTARFHGQMKEPPYTMSSGALSGVGGRIMQRRGQYDQ